MFAIMNITNTIKSLFKINQSSQKLTFFNQFTEQSKRDFDLDKQFLTGYTKLCIDKRASLISSQKYYVASYDNTTDTYPEITQNNWLLELIENPSITFDLSFREILNLTSYWLDYDGNAYLWFRRSDLNSGKVNKYPTEIILLPSKEITMNIGKSGIESYSITLNGLYLTIPANEICHIKTMGIPNESQDPLYYYKGISKFKEPLKLDVENDYYLREYANNELAKQGQPSLLLTHNEFEVEKQHSEAVKNSLISRYGAKYAPMVFGVGSGFRLEPLVTTASFLSSNSSLFKDGLNTEIAQRIATMFGFSFDYLLNRIPYANLTEAKAILYEQTIEPQTLLIEDQLNRYINKNIDADVFIKHQSFEYNDKSFELLVMQTLLSYNLVSIEEAREWAGYDPKIIGELTNETNNTERTETEQNETSNENVSSNETTKRIRLSLEKLFKN